MASLPRSGGGAATATPRTKDRLLDVAADLFRRKGYEQATTRELAEELGITKATLYHHIRNKEDLLEALCLEAVRRLTEEVHAIPEDDPEQHLRSIVICHLTSAVRDQNLHAATLGSLESLAPERQARVTESRKAYERMICDVIRHDQQAGRLRTDISAEHLTLALLNLINWTIYWYRPDGPSTPQQIAEEFADIYLQGAVPR